MFSWVARTERVLTRQPPCVLVDAMSLAQDCRKLDRGSILPEKRRATSSLKRIRVAVNPRHRSSRPSGSFLAGRSFRKANQPAVIGPSISLAVNRPPGSKLQAASGRPPVTEGLMANYIRF